jgi:hypothetical protein
MKRDCTFRILIFKRPSIRVEFHAPHCALLKYAASTSVKPLIRSLIFARTSTMMREAGFATSFRLSTPHWRMARSGAIFESRMVLVRKPASSSAAFQRRRSSGVRRTASLCPTYLLSCSRTFSSCKLFFRLVPFLPPSHRAMTQG